MRKRIAFVLAVTSAALAWVVLAPASSSAAPPSISCTSVHDNESISAITVPVGASCEIDNSSVAGSVIVNKNASFRSCNSAIAGSITATQAYVNLDSDTSVGGAITLNKPGTQMFAGAPNQCVQRGPVSYASTLCPYFVGGSITVQNGPWDPREVSIGECGYMSIAGSVTIQNNKLYVEIDGANIHGSLICINNWPPAVANGVSVGGTRIGCLAPPP